MHLNWESNLIPLVNRTIFQQWRHSARAAVVFLYIFLSLYKERGGIIGYAFPFKSQMEADSFGKALLMMPQCEQGWSVRGSWTQLMELPHPGPLSFRPLKSDSPQGLPTQVWPLALLCHPANLPASGCGTHRDLKEGLKSFAGQA